METFAVDKSFYDIGTSDLKELWDSDLDPVSVILMFVNWSHLRNSYSCALSRLSLLLCVCVCLLNY
jgi:hypothetical protein